MVFLYITCKDSEEAKKIGHELVKEKLAACVNIHPIASMYSEDSAVKEVSEAAMIVKTIEAKVQQIEDVVRRLHSYKIPCIATFSMFRLNREYKDWMVNCVA